MSSSGKTRWRTGDDDFTKYTGAASTRCKASEGREEEEGTAQVPKRRKVVRSRKCWGGHYAEAFIAPS